MGNIDRKDVEKIKTIMLNQMIREELEDEGVEDDPEAIRELCLEYGGNRGSGRNAELEHYLVNNAVLKCDRATTEVKIVNGCPVGYGSLKNADERKTTKLIVSEGATRVNGVRVATVKDNNVMSFECNCSYVPNEEETRKIIDNMVECRKKGTCIMMMDLEDKWENIIRDTRYMSYSYQTDSGVMEQAEGVTMLSMLFCRKGGIITPIDSGQQIRIDYTQEDIDADILKGLYTQEDFDYLTATLCGEANTYAGYVAIAYEILNRCNSRGKSIKDIVTAHKQYTGFKSENVKKVTDNQVIGAAVAVLRGEVDNPIGDIEYHYGKVSGYDLWYEDSKCKVVIVIGEGPYRNVFYKPEGVHNMQPDKTDDYKVIYNGEEDKWLLEGVVKYVDEE